MEIFWKTLIFLAALAVIVLAPALTPDGGWGIAICFLIGAVVGGILGPAWAWVEEIYN